MLSPKKVKHRKQQKGNLKGIGAIGASNYMLYPQIAGKFVLEIPYLLTLNESRAIYNLLNGSINLGFDFQVLPSKVAHLN